MPAPGPEGPLCSAAARWGMQLAGAGDLWYVDDGPLGMVAA
jgi:hypothetical protein